MILLRLLTLFGLSQACFIFLGNALKSVVTSTVFNSEGDFASFLNISVDKTGILVEILIGSAVLALAVTPVILTVERARKVTAFAALGSMISFALLGLVMLVNPAFYVRELAVIATFSLGGFCIAFFAPLAQQAINAGPDDGNRVLLTTVWTSAQPIAFLITPQLVKYVANDVGTGPFFLGFAALPLLFMALSFLVLPKGLGTEGGTEGKPLPVTKGTLFLIFASLIGFELLTASVSFAGLLSPYTLTLAVLFLFFLAALVQRMMRPSSAGIRAGLPPVALFLLMALFILEFPSTGFYDTAYLVRHLCTPGLIEDRASLGAAAQIAAVFLGGMAYGRWPGAMPFLVIGGILLLLAGTVGYVYYPDMVINAPFFYISKMIASAGMGLVTAVIVAAVMGESRGNPLMVLLPSFIIMFGTEFGLEILEILFEAVKLAGFEELEAYRTVFYLQVALILLAIPPALWAIRRGAASRKAAFSA